MRIPKKDTDAWALYDRVIHDCFASRSNRKAQYASWRLYYLYGTDNGDTDYIYNKIYPHLDTVLSFMYSNETTRFSIQTDASIPDQELKKVPKLNAAVNDEWHSSNGDIVFSNALEWAHVYATELVKLRWNGKAVEPFVCDPHNFGVLREDVSQLSRQEAFCQEYLASRTQLEYELRACEHPRLNNLLSAIVPTGKRNEIGGDTRQLLVTNTQIPTSGGSVLRGSYVGNLGVDNQYVAKVTDDLIQMRELYIYDDQLKDFRIITLASDNLVVFDRPLNRMFVDHEIPFIQVCPCPDHNYFWGRSDVERLIPLQIMRNERFAQVRKMMAKQANPPKSMSGFPGSTDEMGNALDTPGGVVFSDMPGAKVEDLSPQIPEDLFQDIESIDKQFEEMTGVNNVMSGRGEPGVRSTGHAAQLANLGSSRTKKRALIIEDSLEKVATLYLQIMQKFDDSRFKDQDGDYFIPAQFTKEFLVKVDAHSNSPIFTSDLAQKAVQLFKMGAITKERVIEMMGVPMEQLLKQDLKDKIEPADRAKAAAEADKARSKVRSIK
jgi:hypothetical protein